MVKVISLSDEAYERLKDLKGKKSFSKVVIELSENKKSNKEDIMKLAGAWKEESDKWESIKKDIKKDRKKFRLRGQK